MASGSDRVRWAVYAYGFMVMMQIMVCTIKLLTVQYKILEGEILVKQFTPKIGR